jgi:hypothetical protein
MIAVWEDILTLLKFRLPDRPVHQGLVGPYNLRDSYIFLDAAYRKLDVFFKEQLSSELMLPGV